MKLSKLVEMLKIIALLIVIISFLFGLIWGVIVGYTTYQNYKSNKEYKHLYTSYQDSVFYFSFITYKANGFIKFKPNPDNFSFSYILEIAADAGLSFQKDSGNLVIELKDKDGFVIFNFSPTNFSDIKDNNDFTISRKSTGNYDIPISTMLKTKAIEIGHNFSINPIFKDDLHKNSGFSEFGMSNEDWNNKAKKIQIGMTNDKMLSVAGEPQTIEFRSDDEYSAGFDLFKYKYGKKWVYFKNHLVYLIK